MVKDNKQKQIVIEDEGDSLQIPPIDPKPPLLIRSNNKKRKKISPVWKDFELFYVEGEAFAKCKHCKIDLVAKSRNGTSSLINHLEKCPAKKTVDIQNALLGGRKNEEGKFVVGNWHFNQDALREKIVLMIIRHGYPINVVEHEGFIDVMREACPMYKQVGRNATREDILHIHQSIKINFMKELDAMNCRISFTTDMWTSNQSKGYMAITAHYIDDSWVLREKILRFMCVEPPYTAEVLSECF